MSKDPQNFFKLTPAGKNKQPQRELADITSGEIFQPKSRNHYEENDGIPVAPQVELNRPSIRQRIENLINRDPGALQRYIQDGPPDGSEGTDLNIPDDPDAPLTASEMNYVDSVAAELSEQAPLPDEGLPRPPQQPASPAKSPEAPGGGSQGDTRPPEAAPAPGGAAAAPAAMPSTVRT